MIEVLRRTQGYFNYTREGGGTFGHPQVVGKPFHIWPERKPACAGLELVSMPEINEII